MILVDSSVWIDYFNGINSQETDILDKTLGVQSVAAGDLMLLEVLQGFRYDADFENAKGIFDAIEIFDMLGRELALASAENYRSLRKQGITVRKSVDVLIATFCIKRRIPLLFSDRDFTPFVEHLGLVDASTTTSN